MDDSCDAGDDSGGEEYDFVSTLESWLERDVDLDDFVEMLEDQLEHELLSDVPLHAISLFDDGESLIINDELTLNDLDEDYGIQGDQQTKRVRGKSHEKYQFGNIFQSCWYHKFLMPDKDGVEGSRSKTQRISGRDRQGAFRATFRLTLDKVEKIAQLMINKNVIMPTRRINTAVAVQVKAELHVLGALCVVGHGLPFGVISTYSNISKEEHRLFFHKFIDFFFEQHKDYIYLPRDANELRNVMQKYRAVGLPGAMGSKDVVHVKWSRAPAGDFNRCKGKESYPSIAFQCISDFNRRIMGVSRAQYGTRNDKSIVRRDHNVNAIRSEWYSAVEWEYFTIDGEVRTDVGCYLICDNGYLRWPMSICPYLHADKTSMEGYFSTNLESVRKDVECVFGIIKKRWKVLDHGFKFRSMAICEKIFFTCCCLHNEMLDMMESRTTRYRVLRGLANQTDGMWLADGCDDIQFLMEMEEENNEPSQSKRALSAAWARRRRRLAEHLFYSRRSSFN